MARAYASRIIKAPVETVWSVVRNFNGLPAWAPGIVDSKIEGGLDAIVGNDAQITKRPFLAGQHPRRRPHVLVNQPKNQANKPEQQQGTK